MFMFRLRFLQEARGRPPRGSGRAQLYAQRQGATLDRSHSRFETPSSEGGVLEGGEAPPENPSDSWEVGAASLFQTLRLILLTEEF